MAVGDKTGMTWQKWDKNPVMTLALHGERAREVRGIAEHKASLLQAVFYLVELREIGTAEHGLELRLPDENDLEQLPFLRLEVRQEPHLLEKHRREILRFVDQHGHVAIPSHREHSRRRTAVGVAASPPPAVSR